LKYALSIEYEGSKYNGFQSQPNKNTIQDNLEKALSTIANEKISVICAGRTDAKVHARLQVCHFETEVIRTDYSWLMGSNKLLPKDIRIMEVKQVSDDFHARFSATARDYKYVIYNDKILPTSLNQKVYHCYDDLNVINLAKASEFFIGEHDFSSLRDSQCQSASPIRIIKDIIVMKKEKFIIVHIKGTAFLHHMIRNLMGVLIEVGTGKQNVDWAFDVLKAKDRKQASKTLAATGLYFYEVTYDDYNPICNWHFLDIFDL
jgi:tRNA pseudouridine38-40 synthase